MRDEFHADIDALIERLVETAAVCDRMLEQAVHALVTPGSPGADAVIERDNDVDAAFALNRFDNNGGDLFRSDLMAKQNLLKVIYTLYAAGVILQIVWAAMACGIGNMVDIGNQRRKSGPMG
jgi:hypothetical protein